MNTIITHFVEKCTENFNETLKKIFPENGTVTDLTDWVWNRLNMLLNP